MIRKDVVNYYPQILPTFQILAPIVEPVASYFRTPGRLLRDLFFGTLVPPWSEFVVALGSKAPKFKRFQTNKYNHTFKKASEDSHFFNHNQSKRIICYFCCLKKKRISPKPQVLHK